MCSLQLLFYYYYFYYRQKNDKSRDPPVLLLGPELTAGAELTAPLGGSAGPGRPGWRPHEGEMGSGAGKLGAPQAWPWWRL